MHPSPYGWTAPQSLPRREWLCAKHYVRKYVSTTVAPGGVGKSSLAFVEAAAMASGRPLLGDSVSHPSRVWVINLEDPQDELDRRMAAVVKMFGLRPDDIGDRLFLDSGRSLAKPLKIADGMTVHQPVVDRLIEAILDLKIDCVIVDPFVSCHLAPENDNAAIDRVAKAWAEVAERANCAVDLVHHVRKSSNGQAVFSVDDARGASALIGAVRSARVLNVMSSAEAKAFGIDEPRSLFRVDNGKSSMMPPSSSATWRRLVSVPLGNGTREFPGGDSVGVVEAWKPPEALYEVSPTDVALIQQRIASGVYRGNSQARDWVGNPIGEVLGLDPNHPGDKSRISTIVKSLTASGAFVSERRKDTNGAERPVIKVGKPVFGEPDPSTPLQ